MDTHTPQRRDHGFLLGMMTGTVVGAGLAVWFAPRLKEELRQRAKEQYWQASTRVVEMADELSKKGQRVRDDVAEAVAQGAREVERVATAIRSDRQ